MCVGSIGNQRIARDRRMGDSGSKPQAPRAPRVTGHWRNQETTLHPITSLRYLSDQGESKCPASARWSWEERKICAARQGSTTKTFQAHAHRGNSSTRAGPAASEGQARAPPVIYNKIPSSSSTSSSEAVQVDDLSDFSPETKEVPVLLLIFLPLSIIMLFVSLLFFLFTQLFFLH